MVKVGWGCRRCRRRSQGGEEKGWRGCNYYVRMPNAVQSPMKMRHVTPYSVSRLGTARYQA
ncbi:hypothetical protein M5K25_013839 [Dendrobium thyrsiflorum]|uniref:Uncharacterized protein n=1 Tax=Dendrobium thyrsiflorum TaxID=117978 RepID=A0ABD0UUC8_DENTH